MANNDDVSRQSFEQTKEIIEYTKHLTTLSTGSVVLLAAFLEKVFARPVWKPLIALSFIGFVTSIVASVVAHTYMLDLLHEREGSATWKTSGPVAGVSILVIWLGFLLGIISLSIFAVKNFLL